MTRAINLCAALAGSLLLLGAGPVATVKLTESGQAKVKGMAPSFGGWDIAGKKVLTLDNLRTRPTPATLIVTFGASWCVACAQGLPRLRALATRHPELRLILVDVESDAAKAQEFADKMGIDGPALLDKFEGIAKTYGLNTDGKLSLPRTFLIDAKGRVQAIYREEGADLESVIEADLSSLAPDSTVNAADATTAR